MNNQKNDKSYQPISPAGPVCWVAIFYRAYAFAVNHARRRARPLPGRNALSA